MLSGDNYLYIFSPYVFLSLTVSKDRLVVFSDIYTTAPVEEHLFKYVILCFRVRVCTILFLYYSKIVPLGLCQ